MGRVRDTRTWVSNSQVSGSKEKIGYSEAPMAGPGKAAAESKSVQYISSVPSENPLAVDRPVRAEI